MSGNGNGKGGNYDKKPTLLGRRQKWGFGCRSMMAGVIEYGSSMKPVALIDYLHEDAPPKSGRDERYVVLKCLCNNAAIPLFVCRYGNDFSWFQPHALNDYAAGLLMRHGRMDEVEWVRFLYRIRNEPVPTGVESAILGNQPIKFETQDEQPAEETF